MILFGLEKRKNAGSHLAMVLTKFSSQKKIVLVASSLWESEGCISDSFGYIETTLLASFVFLSSGILIRHSPGVVFDKISLGWSNLTVLLLNLDHSDGFRVGTVSKKYILFLDEKILEQIGGVSMYNTSFMTIRKALMLVSGRTLRS